MDGRAFLRADSIFSTAGRQEVGYTSVFEMDEDEDEGEEIAPHLMPHLEDFDDDGRVHSFF